MIGVLARDSEHPIVGEFFELFKTPWEFYRVGRPYEVIISADGRIPEDSAKLVLIYSCQEQAFDQRNQIQIRSQKPDRMLTFNGDRLPIYGRCLTFSSADTLGLADEVTRHPAAAERNGNGRKLVRIGFDLFKEIRHLLLQGQPVIHAGVPTLDVHIALLRALITGCSIPLVEIPPVPRGYNFIACLTHDVDHPRLRNHKFDHTMFGFLYRATIGSFVHLLRGRKSVKQFGANCAAALSLPLVHLRMAKDFWCPFDRYAEIEKGLTSTFFVIPRKDDPGENPGGRKVEKRAARYDVREVAKHMHQLRSLGREVGVHGIDAWHDSAVGREELENVCRITGSSEMGVRMHWLYFNGQSPAVLDKAGFSYDSTVGYNETVGYRAGTTQAFKPPGAKTMLELPLHVMDTALFFPGHLDLTEEKAALLVHDLIQNALRFGGTFTVNWHDRSIAPERQWDGFYVKLLDELKSQNAWFTTASKAVGWFNRRRSAVFKEVITTPASVRVKALVNEREDLPGLRIRVYKPKPLRNGPEHAQGTGADFVDLPFDGDTEVQVSF